jgi:hypothetical protein
VTADVARPSGDPTYIQGEAQTRRHFGCEIVCMYVGCVHDRLETTTQGIQSRYRRRRNEGKEMRYRRVRLGDYLLEENCLLEEDCPLEGVALSSVFSGRETKERACERVSADMTGWWWWGRGCARELHPQISFSLSPSSPVHLQIPGRPSSTTVAIISVVSEKKRRELQFKSSNHRTSRCFPNLSPPLKATHFHAPTP